MLFINSHVTIIKKMKNNLKNIFWWSMCILWSPFELIYIGFSVSKEISPIAVYLATKINP